MKTNISGSINNSDWVKLDKEWYDDFQRGKNDTYVLSFQRALGTIIGIDLKKEGWIGTGLDAWKCSKEYFEILKKLNWWNFHHENEIFEIKKVEIIGNMCTIITSRDDYAKKQIAEFDINAKIESAENFQPALNSCK